MIKMILIKYSKDDSKVQVLINHHLHHQNHNQTVQHWKGMHHHHDDEKKKEKEELHDDEKNACENAQIDLHSHQHHHHRKNLQHHHHLERSQNGSMDEACFWMVFDDRFQRHDVEKPMVEDERMKC